MRSYQGSHVEVLEHVPCNIASSVDAHVVSIDMVVVAAGINAVVVSVDAAAVAEVLEKAN